MTEKFFKYIRAGDLENVKKCIEEKNVDPSTDDNWAICLASEKGYIEIVRYLISLDEKYNINPSAQTNYSICLASANGHLEVVKYLMSLDKKYNIDPSAIDNLAIRCASYHGYLEAIKYLMSLDKEYKIDPSAIDNCSIRWASANGHLEVVKYLISLDKKYNIDPSADKNYAICWASGNGHLEVVKLLSTHYTDKLPISEDIDYGNDINNYIKEFNENPIEMNKKIKLHFFNDYLKYYSLTILFNDNYLTLEDINDENIKKFFNINKGLNHDILMLLINILIKQNKIIISGNDFNYFLKENMKWLFFDNGK